MAAVLLVGLLVFLAADPEAHEFFHDHAKDADHACVVTAFATGESYYTLPVVSLPPDLTIVRVVHASARESLREPVSYRLLPICGPPSAA